MESVQNVLNVIKKDAFMASIDLKDAFYSVPVAEHHAHQTSAAYADHSYFQGN